MAEDKVNREADGKYKLKDPKDTELDGISNKYEVYTETEKLKAARQAKTDCTWFVSFVIKKQGEQQPTTDPLSYTVKFNKPGKDADPVQVFYYYNGEVHQVTDFQTEGEGGKKKIKLTLTIGDPPVGSVP